MLIQFCSRCSEAEQAIKMNGRYYGGLQIFGHYITLEKWGPAICGKYWQCNYTFTATNLNESLKNIEFLMSIYYYYIFSKRIL